MAREEILIFVPLAAARLLQRKRHRPQSSRTHYSADMKGDGGDISTTQESVEGSVDEFSSDFDSVFPDTPSYIPSSVDVSADPDVEIPPFSDKVIERE